MERVHPSQETIRFAVFEVDPRAGELRKQGGKIKLQEQPFCSPLGMESRSRTPTS